MRKSVGLAIGDLECGLSDQRSRHRSV